MKNLPSNTGDAGLIPGQGTKIPHAMGQLSPRTTTTEPVCPGARMPQLERQNPHATTREKPKQTACRNQKILNKDPSVPQLRPNAAKKNKENK